VRLINLASDRVAVMFSGEYCVMKKLSAIVVASLALVLGQPFIVQHWSDAVAQIPFPAGQFSDTAHVYVALCVNPSTIADEPCSTSGAAVLADAALDNASLTLDSAGNGCATITEVDSFLPIASSSSISPSTLAAINTSPPFVTTNSHGVFTLDDYDQTTGIGHRSFTVYFGGTCTGASFNSSGATKVNTGKQQFVVTNGGNRIDFVGLSFSNPSFGSFSDSGTELRQTSQNGQNTQ